MLSHFSLPLFLVLATQSPAPIPAGVAQCTIDVDKHALECFTYKPKQYENGPLIVVFHGMLRNADTYRDNAIGLADRHGAIIVAPEFDQKRYPNEAYQSGGLFKKGQLQPKDHWTWSLVPKLVDEIRKREGKPKMPYYLLGHSAGGQFLCRLTGFVPTSAERIVVANPGGHLFPSEDYPFPYGFGKLPKEIGGDDAIKRFLGQPMTIYVGTADKLKDNLPMGEVANKQGPNRYERGKNCFKAAQELAKAKGWSLNWTIVEAPDIGHDAKKMFDHANCSEALFGKKLGN